jgi:hypothetical protein
MTTEVSKLVRLIERILAGAAITHGEVMDAGWVAEASSTKSPTRLGSN